VQPIRYTSDGIDRPIDEESVQTMQTYPDPDIIGMHLQSAEILERVLRLTLAASSI
jgi:hypothetical protein